MNTPKNLTAPAKKGWISPVQIRSLAAAAACALILSGGCAKSDEGYNVSDIDSLVRAEELYALPYDAFSSRLDTLAGQLDERDEPEAAFYFKAARYGYSLNHCLATHDTAFEYGEGMIDLVTAEDLNRSDLLTKDWYRNFLAGWLDLSAKYTIAGGHSGYSDHMFMRTQWDIAMKHLKGEVLDAALLGLTIQQMQEFGLEGTPAMIDEFMQLCDNEMYRSQVSLRYNNLRTALYEAEKYTYRVDDGDTLSAFVYHAEEKAGPSPCIVIAHGGGWYLGHPLQRNHIPREFTKLGVTAVCIEYRIKGRTNDDPVTALKDMKAAIRWVRQNASELGVDPGRVFAGGLSAGGHLAAAVALIDGYEHADSDHSLSSMPDGVILWSGCVDPTVDTWFRWCMGRMTDETKLSPLHNVDPAAPPFLLFQGTDDEFLDHRSHMAFRDSMLAEGNACKLVMFEGLGHTDVYAQEMTDEYRGFLSGFAGR